MLSFNLLKKCVLILIILLSTGTFAQTLSGHVNATVYSFERADSSQSMKKYIRDYNQLFLNASYKKFSLRTSMNLETGLKNSLDSDSRLRMYNFFLEGRNLWDFATIRIGRQPIFHGVASGIFDGALVKVSHKLITFETYYGGLVPSQQEFKLHKDWSNNFLVGVNASATVSDFNFGIGYVNKNYKSPDYYATRLDENFNSILYLVRKNSLQYQYMNADLSYAPEKSSLAVRSKYEYDINLQKTSKVELEGEIPVINNLDVVVYGNYREPRVKYNSIFSVFDYGNTKEGEIGATYKLLPGYSVTGKFGYVKYQDDESSRLNLGFQTKYGSLGFRKTFGYSGEIYAFDVNAGYTYFDGLLTPSVSLSYGKYKLVSYVDEKDLMSLVAGLNIRPFRAFSIDVQGQYMDNPIYSHDFRLLLKFNYRFFTIL
jgi:hypothetical protein